jgi:hypothetical protein
VVIGAKIPSELREKVMATSQATVTAIASLIT